VIKRSNKTRRTDISLVLLILCTCIMNIFADVPVRDSILANQELEHNTFSTSYLTRIVAILDNLANATDYVRQSADLAELIKLEENLANICDKSCNQNEFMQVHEYLDKLNQNFAGKFRSAGIALKNSSDSVKDIQKLMGGIVASGYILGGGKVKAAEIAVAVQQAALKTQQEMQMILMQMQTFAIEREQKHMMETKIERANTNAVYIGFRKSGL